MKKMLLIEDDKQLSEMYAKKFQSGDFEVTIAHDGAEAIQKAKEVQFDIAVLDLMLPGISGVNVLEILSSDKKTAKLPIIVYTNYGDKDNREKCLTYGADEFILKIDSTPESLIGSVNRILGGKINEES